MYVHVGNVRQGIRLANELQDKELFSDAGEILEQQKQYVEAAAMYLKGEQYERTADIYTRYLIKSDKSKITEAAVIMEKVCVKKCVCVFLRFICFMSFESDNSRGGQNPLHASKPTTHTQNHT
jgi:hypothetical protein